MAMGNISKELAKQAKKNGICQEWYEDLRGEKDIDKLLDLYLKGIDFCLANDYPTNDYIRANFKGKMEAKGIHLDEVINVVSERKVVTLGKCFGTIETFGFDICEIFVKHDSEIIVTANGNSFVMIDLFDNAKLSVVVNGNAKVCVNRYGGAISHSKFEQGQFKIREKNKSTY